MGKYICKDCLSIVSPKKKYKGAFWIELLLWLIGFFLIPFTLGISLLIGISYSLWRIVGRPKVCPICESQNIIPVSTPAGRELLENINKEKQ